MNWIHLQRKFTPTLRVFVLCFLLASQFLSGCTEWVQQLPLSSPPEVNPISQSESQALINFLARVPANSPEGAAVYLTVLDEVTGLALNSQRYAMKAIKESQGNGVLYSVTLPFPVGAEVLYRYERANTKNPAIAVLEHLSSNVPVRYRIYHVFGPGEVTDIISRWTDTPFNGSTGRISGKATDSESGQPIPDILVTAGGQQSLTASDGSFILEGLPPGVHNLVAYALNGAYRTFQQGALIDADSVTPAPLTLSAVPMINTLFIVRLPENTPPLIPVRLAGNLSQLGNTFGNLTGGISTLASRMPVLKPLPDGRYSLTIALPAGADIRYKYTLGDGYWNAEHTAQGEFRVRQVFISEQKKMIEDEVETWQAGKYAPISFDLTVPEITPAGDSVHLQLNPLFGWTEPIPMWQIGANHWVYILYSPLNMSKEFHYRYCRNGMCGAADDLASSGAQNQGRTMQPNNQPQTIKDEVKAWAWIDPESQPAPFPADEVLIRASDFIAGIEFQTGYPPTWRSQTPKAVKNIRSMGANWVIISPTWTYTRLSPPTLEPIPGQDAGWQDISDVATQTIGQDLKIAIFPQPHSFAGSAQWWEAAPRTAAWWDYWFERYRIFALHHADLAAKTGAQGLIIGGEWVTPALPGGLLIDGQSSGVPNDAAQRWHDLIGEIRSRYTGLLLWALPYNQPVKDMENIPEFLSEVDLVYLLWSASIIGNTPEDTRINFTNLLDGDVWLNLVTTGSSVVLAAECKSSTDARPLDIQAQTDCYSAMLSETNQRSWLSGFVSRGYYPPAALQDQSASINGKPAADLISFWFPRFLGMY